MQRLMQAFGVLLVSAGLATISARVPLSASAQPYASRQDSRRQTSASTQQVPPKPTTPQQNAKPPLPAGTIHTQVNEITTPVTVEDKKGNFLLGLEQSDFHVFDNGVEQHINRWSVDDRPLALALVIETSSHVGVMAKQIHGTGIVFTDMVMALRGEGAVISYGDTVEVLQPFTSDHDAVEKAVNGLKFKDDGMRLYDGMWEGTQLLEKQPDDSHRVLVVIGEAQDGGSKHRLNDILVQAQKANITIYTIGLSSTAADLRADPVPQASEQRPDVTSGGYPAPPLPPTSAMQPAVSPAPTSGPMGVGGGGGSIDFLSLAVFLVQRVNHTRKNHAMAVAVQSTGGAYYHPFKDNNI